MVFLGPKKLQDPERDQRDSSLHQKSVIYIERSMYRHVNISPSLVAYLSLYQSNYLSIYPNNLFSYRKFGACRWREFSHKFRFGEIPKSRCICIRYVNANDRAQCLLCRISTTSQNIGRRYISIPPSDNQPSPDSTNRDRVGGRLNQGIITSNSLY